MAKENNLRDFERNFDLAINDEYALQRTRRAAAFICMMLQSLYYCEKTAV